MHPLPHRLTPPHRPAHAPPRTVAQVTRNSRYLPYTYIYIYTQVILNEASLKAEVLTAKCSELNVIVPGSEFASGEYKEFALPEQFTSKWNAATKKYETECMSHSA